jgi:hypothetical protein
MNAAIFWDIALCSLYVKQCFKGKFQLLHAGFLIGCISALKMEVILSSETSVHIQTTLCYITEGGNVHNYRCKNLKSNKDNVFSLLCV